MGKLQKTNKANLKAFIVDAMGRATTPQTGWCIYQKSRRKFGGADGARFCEIMYEMEQAGELDFVKYNIDGDSVYSLPIKASS